MNELLKINCDADRITLSARELHEFLEIGTQYTKWFERMSDYGFDMEVDYRPISQKRLTAQGNETTYVDHEITLDMAKELAMIQRSDKGKQARQYFIQVEKEWNSPEKIMARALQIANKEIDSLRLENKEMKPKALFADAVATSKNSCLIGELAKIVKANGVDIGQKRLFAWLRENGYLMKHGESYNLPTQKSMDMELMEIKKTTISNPDGSIRTTSTTKVTGKGQIYFVNKLIKAKEV